jgi:hypothetical protein
MTPVDLEMQIEINWRRLLLAATDEGRANCCRDYIAAVNARNAARTPQQVADLERARGLR